MQLKNIKFLLVGSLLFSVSLDINPTFGLRVFGKSIAFARPNRLLSVNVLRASSQSVFSRAGLIPTLSKRTFTSRLFSNSSNQSALQAQASTRQQNNKRHDSKSQGLFRYGAALIGTGIAYSIFSEFEYTSISQLFNAIKNGSILSYTEFTKALKAYDELAQRQFSNTAHWLNSNEQPNQDAQFKPYVQKVIVPEGAKVAMWGDLHGDVKSILRNLEHLKHEGYIDDQFKIIKPNFYMLFLGDYVDRGEDGVETMYTLMRLKLANPDHVFLARGNHEDCKLNYSYGFYPELEKKFATKSDDALKLVAQFYEQLPVAIFLGYKSNTDKPKDFALCCHGGIEPGFSPKKLLTSEDNIKFAWLGQLNRAQWAQHLSHEKNQALRRVIPSYEIEDYVPASPIGNGEGTKSVGFMWNDFCVDSGQKLADFTPGRGWRFGKELAQDYTHNNWLKDSGIAINKIFRAHQHNGDMLKLLAANQGIASLWNEKVYTLFSAPTVGYGDFPDSFAIVTASKNWEVDHKKYPIA